jgi:hypothetical protein
MPNSEIATDLRRGIRILGVATVALYVVVVIAVVLVWLDSQAKRDALRLETTRTTNALCTLKGDLIARINLSKAFLKDHPKGVPGISATIIKNDVAYQQQTVDALAVIKCA